MNDLTLLPRKMVLQLRANKNVSLGSGYRAYPGFSWRRSANNSG